jgi:hypothetical protein
MFIKMLLSSIPNENSKNEILNTLQSAGCHPEAIDFISKESEFSLEYLNTLTESGEPVQEEALRNFLTKRWNYIRNTDASYPCYPNSPINRMCIAIAHHLAQPDEPIAQVLMPSITINHYDILADDLIPLTEKINASGDRELDLSRFLISEDGKAIIPIQEWFEAQIRNTGEFFHHMYSMDHKLVPLTEHEKFLIQQSVAPNSIIFLDEFALRKKLISAEGTLAQALLKLCDGLMSQGVTSGRGTGDQAGANVYPIISDFLLIWHKTLSDRQRQSLGALRTSYHSLRLDTHLLILQSAANIPQLPSLTQAQLDSIRDLETCVEVNSRGIQHILERHLEKFSQVFLNQSANPSNPSLQTFGALIESINEKIHLRQTHIQEHSDSALKLLYPETRNADKIYKYSIALKGFTLNDMHSAIIDYGINRVREMLRHINNIHSFSPPGHSLLDFALHHHAFTIALLLMEAGLKLTVHEIHKKNHIGHSYLYPALEHNTPSSYEIACALIEGGADLNGTPSQPPQYLAIRGWASGNDKIIAALLKRKDLDFQACDSKGRNALYYAISHNKTNWVKILIDKGLDLNTPFGPKQQHPISLAFDYQHQDMIITLLELGAKLDCKNSQGMTVLENWLSTHFLRRYGLSIKNEIRQRAEEIKLKFKPENSATALSCISLFEVSLFYSWYKVTVFLLHKNPDALTQMLDMNVARGEANLLDSMTGFLFIPETATLLPRHQDYSKQVLMASIQKNLNNTLFHFLNNRRAFIENLRLSFPEIISLPRNSAYNFWEPIHNGGLTSHTLYYHHCRDTTPDQQIILYACAIEWSLRNRFFGRPYRPAVNHFTDNLCQAINAQDLSKVCALMIRTKRIESTAHFRFIAPLLRNFWELLPSSLQQYALRQLPPEPTCFPKIFSRGARVFPQEVIPPASQQGQTLSRG